MYHWMLRARFADLDGIGQAGIVTALLGGVLGILRGLQFFLGPGAFGRPGLLVASLALGVLGGLALSLARLRALGGVLAAGFGLALVLVGAPTPGVLAVVGGALVWISAGKRLSESEDASESSTTSHVQGG